MTQENVEARKSLDLMRAMVLAVAPENTLLRAYFMVKYSFILGVLYWLTVGYYEIAPESRTLGMMIDQVIHDTYYPEFGFLAMLWTIFSRGILFYWSFYAVAFFISLLGNSAFKVMYTFCVFSLTRAAETSKNVLFRAKSVMKFEPVMDVV